jgi:hypothetical protein
MASMQTAPVMNQPPSAIQWLKICELDYTLDNPYTSNENNPKQCCRCGACPEKLFYCSKCSVSGYCDKSCQVQDWPAHKRTCVGCISLSLVDKKERDRNVVFAEIRLYACPYAVHHAQTLGPGFLFVQSSLPLAQMATPSPNNTSKDRPMRSLLLHYLTLGEYDTDLCRDDFELTLVRTELQAALSCVENDTHVIVLMRFRCGHVALGIAPLLPDYAVCKKLGADYYKDAGSGALQLNLDDM